MQSDFPPSYNFDKSEISNILEESFGDFQKFEFTLVPKVDGILIFTQELIDKARLVKMFYFGSGDVSKEAQVVQKYFRNFKIQCETLKTQSLENLLIPLRLPTDANSEYEKMVVINQAIKKLDSRDKIQILAAKKQG